jgi:soluble lytic murein transglycosylase
VIRLDDDLRQSTQQKLLTQLIRRHQHQAAQDWLKQMPEVSSEHLVEALIRDALRQKDWEEVYAGINRLSPEAQQSSRWLYWRARSQQTLKLSNPAQPTPEQTFTQLAMGRGYYSFLAADRLERQYTLGDNPVTARPERVAEIAEQPATKRARELLAVDEINPARREWLSVTKQLDEEGHLAAAKLAHQWGWHRKTIQSLAAVKQWDDLQMRYPLAYNQQVLKIAHQQRVSPPLLFSIARQESAFAADAKSPAGALGLMQLMPSTARYTARKAGVRYRNKHDLLTPEKNITLGSHYINELLTQFDGNRILASAAYNAGPSRVKKWLSSTDKQLDHDIWVEIIPFKETRKYVQNILSYSVIYGYRMGRKLPLLTEKELHQRL